VSRFIRVPWELQEEDWFWDDRALATYVRETIAADRARRSRRRYVTTRVWTAVLERFGRRCVYCGREDLPLQREHRLAVINGGLDDEANIVPACWPCNQRKGTDGPENWPIIFGVEP
jgi:5-methylcytosine-specific restriction endonuclease McrA